MLEEGAITEASNLFGSEEREDDGPLRPRPTGEDPGQRKDGGRSGGIIIRSVVCGVMINGRPNAKMVEMSSEQYNLLRPRGTPQNSNGIPGLLPWRVLELRNALLDTR